MNSTGPGRRVLALLAAFAAGLAAQESRPAVAEAAAAAAQAAMAEQRLVGLSLALIRDGAILLTLGIGFADREREIPASNKTLYRWASISKPVTAVAALQLWEQGELDLDRDVRSYVPEFPQKPQMITTRQLLTHLGGIVHYANGKVVVSEASYQVANPFADVVVALDRFKESPLVCEPGARYSYSTHGYILAGAVVQRAGQATFWEQVRERIAEPLGMTTFQPDYQWVAIPGRAIGYRRDRQSNDVVRSTDTDVSWKLPGGGFLSSVEDLARFGIGLLERKLVKPETEALMWTRGQTREGVATTYGLGFQIAGTDGDRLISHGGAQEKTATMLLLAPDGRVRRGVALMCNTEGAALGELARKLLAILAE